MSYARETTLSYLPWSWNLLQAIAPILFEIIWSYLVGMKERTSRCFPCKRDNSHCLHLKNPSIMPLGIFLVTCFNTDKCWEVWHYLPWNSCVLMACVGKGKTRTSFYKTLYCEMALHLYKIKSKERKNRYKRYCRNIANLHHETRPIKFWPP